MAAETPQNPYVPPELDSSVLAPFAGRQSAFVALHQRLTTPSKPGALLFLGGRYSGKTTLLRRFSDFFDETYIPAYLSLREMPLVRDAAWVLALTGALERGLSENEYTLSRLPETPDTDNKLRSWLRDTYLPDLFGMVRRHRVVLLLDDVDCLLDAVMAGKLPKDSVAYLYSLLENQPNLGMALTLDSRRERDVDRLSPLVRGENIFRLGSLSPDESAWLLQTPAAPYYTISDESTAAIHKATGGQPYLLQRCGFFLFQGWAAHPDQQPLTPAAVKTCIPRVYATSAGDFQREWDLLNANERLVLTAVSRLLYTDPLRAIQPAEIEAWLVETDYPLDATAIKAAVRGLEYRDHITLSSDGLTVNTGLWQMWLLENARLPVPRAMQGSARVPVKLLLAVLAGVLLVLLLVLALVNSTPESVPDAPAAPTVTLATGG